ncbi:hypothetical protein V2J09_015986 [Rumex salicifolius]
MSGYPHNNQPGYGYAGSPAQPYAPSAPHKPPKDDYSPSYYGGSAPGKPDKPPKDGYTQPYYGGSTPEKPNKPPKEDYSHSHYGGSAPPMPQPYGAAPPYGSPFASLLPSAFPPGTDPNVIACFQVADQDGSGLIDDKELQRALSSFNQSFSLRTVHLLMYLFTNTNSRKIGSYIDLFLFLPVSFSEYYKTTSPKEFISLFYSLQNWRSIFDRHDRDRSGRIDASELREALLSLGYAVTPTVLDLLMLKFDKTGGKSKAIEYDNFIECCLTVKGLTDKFKAKDTNYSGSATFSYEDFMLTVLPFLVA